MAADSPPDFAIEAARNGGEVPRGGYRVVVLETSGQLRISDFGSLRGAREYANDVASESDDPPPLAYVFDEGLELVARGRHYAAPDEH